MTAMIERDIEREARARRAKFRLALTLACIGAVATAAGFVVGSDRTGDAATGWGVLAGIGFSMIVGGAVYAWTSRPGDQRWRDERPQTRVDRLQASRAWQLWLFPMASLAFLVPGTLAIREILAGEGTFGDYLGVSLPVLYAWVVAAITLGWDHQSRTHRRFLEDELTQALRARAMIAAFGVLMAGATVAFGLGLWRAELGIAALPFALTAAGATAGIRFAWLDREAGRTDDANG